MAKSSVATVSVLLFFVLLLSSSEIPGAEAVLCPRRSQTWFGICLNSDGCNNQCIRWERAFHGACHQDGLGFACFCYYNLRTCTTHP